VRYKVSDIFPFLRTPVGRFQLKESLFQICWPVLALFANLYRRHVVAKTRVIAVVGSLGKTTTMRAVATALGCTIHGLASRNFRSFVAAAVLRIRPGSPHAVIEVGINDVGLMAAYAAVVRPDITVVTLVGSEHRRFLKNFEITRDEKAHMVRVLSKSGVAFLNGDDPNVHWMIGQTEARVVTFGFNETNDIYAGDIVLDWPHGMRFKLCAFGEVRQIKIKLFGTHMVYPILAAIGVALNEGFSLEEVLKRLESLGPAKGRSEVIFLKNGVSLVCDDFKSTSESVESAFEFFSKIPAARKIVVFGDISEKPGSQYLLCRQLGARMAHFADRAIFVGGNSRSFFNGAMRAGRKSLSLVDSGKSVLSAIKALKDDLRPGDVVLIKGRFSQRLDRVALALTGRDVRCDISTCVIRAIRCSQCPMLERGWNDKEKQL
jgi:UDP-N-acetylmuramoyl-tripeptide--D-alanyl-D-alanine ligase